MERMWQSLLARWPLRSTTMALVVLAVLAIGGGAAAGTAMRGELDAKIPLSVSQALVTEKRLPISFATSTPFFSSVSDDQTKFSVALEMFRGDSLTVLVPIINRSTDEAVAEFSIILPDVPTLIEGLPGLTVEATGSGVIDDVLQVSPDSWAFTADAVADGVSASPDDGLLVTVKVAQTAMSGFCEIAGLIRAMEF